MEISDFESNAELIKIIDNARTKLASKVYSDIIDDAGNQYIDLVMEGGGMLGIALVGYIYVLENAGIRFRGIGGTSAGSITALLLAAMDVPANPRAKKLLTFMATKNFYDFVDGGEGTKSLITEALNPDKVIHDRWSFRRPFYIIKIVLLLLGAAKRLWYLWGLNPGDTFHEWITWVLKQEKILTAKDLRNRMEVVPQGLRIIRRTQPETPPEYLSTPETFCPKLAIIASDISTESKVEFPHMAKLYWSEPDKVNPADFVRASMAIPFFFRPFTLKDIPNGLEAPENWNEVGYDARAEGVPEDAVFIDGGIMSNFPIDAFHTPTRVPDAPTFGIKLEVDQRRHKITNLFSLVWGIFNSSRHTLDFDFIHKNPDYRLLVKHIPAKGFNWLDFNMSSENKLNLFLEGAKCAESFLTTFDWEGYKRLRELVMVETNLSLALKPTKAKAEK